MSDYLTYECTACSYNLMSTDADALADEVSARTDYHAMLPEKAEASVTVGGGYRG